MEKKNTGIIILIVSLAVILGLLGGYVITDKLIKNNNSTNSNTNNKEEDKKTNTNNSEQTVTFTMEDAKKLMESYKVTNGINKNAYITDKAELINLATSKVKFTAVKIEDSWTKKLSDPNAFNAYSFDGYLEKGQVKMYKHSDIENYLKALFGPEYSLEKVTSGTKYEKYYYSKEHDGFAAVTYSFGGARPVTRKGSVESVSINGNDVNIIAINTSSYEGETKPFYTEKYEYVFKKSNNNYYLSEMKKLSTDVPKESEQTVTFTMEDAKKLMEKYKITKNSKEGSYYISSMDEIFALVASKINYTSATLDEKLANNLSDSTLILGTVGTGRQVRIFKYSDMQEQLKKLLGSSYTLKKMDLGSKYLKYYYSSDYDGYVEINSLGASRTVVRECNVKSVNNNGDDVHITAINTSSYEGETNPFNTEKSEYVFKKSNNNYYLSEIKKLNN